MRFKVLLSLLAVVCPAGVYAQAVIGSGTVSGQVLDYTGTGIPDTTVTISNPVLGIQRTMDTTDDGTFAGSALFPAPGYSLKVTRKGFENLEYNNFEILVGHTLFFQISLLQSNVQARVKGEKASVSVEERKYEVEQVFTALEVQSLPSADRDPNQLAQFTPMVVYGFNNGVLAFRSEPWTNATWTDGIWTTNTYFFNQPAVQPPASQEAVEQMQVITANAPAQFDHLMGGALNMITRAGTSAFHGDVYDYFNDSSVNAPDRFAEGFRPDEWQHQVGLNAGGPAPRKMFWFINLEDLDRHSEEINRTSNPLIANSLGTAVAPSNCTATAAQCTNAINFLNAQLNRPVSSEIASIGGLAKLDWRPNDFNAVSLEFDAVHRHSTNGTDLNTVSNDGGLLGYNGTYTDESRYAQASYTGVWSGNVVNHASGTFYRDRFSDYENPGYLPSTGALGIDIAGTQFGGNPNLPMVVSDQHYQIVDNLTASSATHALNFGVDITFGDDWIRQIQNYAGDYYYPTLTDFATDYSLNTTSKKDYGYFDQGFGKPVVNLPTKSVSVYAQDTWRPISKLTVELGLIWELPLVPGAPYENDTFTQTGTISTRKLDFAPRLGAAYQLDNRTVVRAGISGYYQPYIGQLLNALYTGNAIYQLQGTVVPLYTNSPIFPHIYSTPNSLPEAATQVIYEASKLRMPVSAQGTVSIERRVFSDWFVSANYLYERGLELWTAANTNLIAPTVIKVYSIDNAAGAVAATYPTLLYNTRSNTDFGQAFEIGNGGRSDYEGASLQVRKRLSRGLTFQGAYTWSHAIDNVSGAPGVAGFLPMTVAPGDYGNSKGDSSFNQPNRATIVFAYQPSFAVGDSWMARYLVNGWQLSSTTTLASGLGETPLVVVNGQQFAGVTMSYPYTINGSGGWLRAPFEQVNSVSTGPMYDVDLRLSRNIPINEHVKALLMFEGYNVFNTQFNTSVNTIQYLATSGILKPVPGFGLGNAAAGYPWGDNARHLQIALRVTF